MLSVPHDEIGRCEVSDWLVIRLAKIFCAGSVNLYLAYVSVNTNERGKLTLVT